MRRRLAVAALAALVVVAAAACPAAAARARRPAPPNPVTLTASFGAGARLGGLAPLDVVLRLDARRLPLSPLVGLELAYPRNLGVVSSGLGLAVCRRTPSDFAAVLIDGPRLGGCPPNSVMGYGTAKAIVRLTNGQAIPEYATMTLLSGPIEQGRLQLVTYVDGQQPFGAKLVFAGSVRDAAAPFGGALAVRMPVIPGIEDLAVISLVRLRVTIGSRAIVYYERRHGRRVAYRPGGIALPSRCPAGGFRFRARVAFEDGTRRYASARTRCPLAPPVPAR